MERPAQRNEQRSARVVRCVYLEEGKHGKSAERTKIYEGGSEEDEY